MVDINTENRVCMFYVINRLNQILTKSENSVGSEVAEFYNELVFNLGVNTVRNYNNPKGENNE
jgi:hypothetical protein